MQLKPSAVKTSPLSCRDGKWTRNFLFVLRLLHAENLRTTLKVAGSLLVTKRKILQMSEAEEVSLSQAEVEV